MHQPVKYYLLVTANPLSDSKAALSIFRMIKRLDILSGDIDIFLPGFHATNKSSAETSQEVTENISMIQKQNQKSHEDYHGKEGIFHTYTESEGDIYFNDVDFANFMMDLEAKCEHFNYYGRTDLVLLPASKGKVLYDKLETFNLDALIDNSSSKLEEFLVTTIKLIKKDPDNDSLALIGIIKEVYDSYHDTREDEDLSNVVIRLDNTILEHMKWQRSDEIFFISYSTKDEFNAYALKGLLEKNGKKVWMAPEGIPNGYDYAMAIPAALRITSRFLVLLSYKSAQSEWVRREIGKAISNKTKMDGIFLDGFTYEDLQKFDHLNFLFENVQLRYSLSDLFNNRNDLITLMNT
jgi:hypothetical protein